MHCHNRELQYTPHIEWKLPNFIKYLGTIYQIESPNILILMTSSIELILSKKMSDDA